MGQIEIVKATINAIKKALAELKKIPAGAPGQKNRQSFEKNLAEKQELLKKLKSKDAQATLEAAGIPVRGGKIMVADVKEILAGTMDRDQQVDFANFCKKATDDQLRNIAIDEEKRTASRADSDYHFQCLDIALEEMQRRGMETDAAVAAPLKDEPLFAEPKFVEISNLIGQAEDTLGSVKQLLNQEVSDKESWRRQAIEGLRKKLMRVFDDLAQLREDVGRIETYHAEAALPERVVFTTPDKQYRIVELVDTDYDLDNLKGDVFNPKHIDEMHQPGMTTEKLADEEKAFEAEVDREGVYGYELQHREPSGDYEHIDSCWGFVGQYDKNSKKYNHYIVDEMKSAIKDEPQEAHSGRISEMREEFKQGKKPAAPIKKMGLENTKDHKQKYVEMHSRKVAIPQADGESEDVDPTEIAEIGSTCSDPNLADEDGEKSWIEMKGGNDYVYSPLSASEVKKLVHGASGKFIIEDWAGNEMFEGLKFDSFDDAEEFLDQELGETYEDERPELHIVDAGTSGYHPEDEMMHHLIQAYICKKFDKMDWYNKHIDLALDHASNEPKFNYSRKDLVEMVDEGKELFHDMDEDEITERPTQFEPSQFDNQIGQEVHAAKEAKCEYILGLSDDEETGLGDGAYDEDIATKECKMAVKDMIKGKAKEVKIRYLKQDGREEGNVLHVFELKGPENLIKEIEEMQ